MKDRIKLILAIMLVAVIIGGGVFSAVYAAVLNQSGYYYGPSGEQFTDAKTTAAPRGKIYVVTSGTGTGDVWTRTTTTWVKNISYTQPLFTYDHTAHSLYSAAGWTAAPLAEYTLFTTTIPGGSMGTNGTLQITTHYTYLSASTNNKRLRYKLGSTVIDDRFENSATGRTTVTAIQLVNRNSESSQLSKPSSIAGLYTASSSALPTFAINTAIDQSLIISAITTTEPTVAATSCLASSGTVTCVKASHGYRSGDYVVITGATPTFYNNSGAATMIVTAQTNTFTYMATGATATTTAQPNFQRYSPITLESVDVEIKRP